MLKHFFHHKSLVTYFSFSLATSVLGFVSSLVLMRLIPPDEFGRIAVFASIQFLVAPVISFAADNLMAVNRSKLDSESYDHFRRSYVSISYLIFSVVQMIFLGIYASGTQHETMFVFIPIAALLKYLINLASIEYVMEEKSFQYGLVQFLTTALSLMLTIWFLMSISASADWRIAALVIADVVFLFVRYKGRMQLLLNFLFDWQQYRKIMRFGFPLLLAVPPSWALNEADKVIVAQYADLKSVGVYAAACAIGGFMVTFNASLLNATMPKLYAALGTQSQSILIVTKRFLWKYVLVSVIFAACFALGYGFFSDVILPEKYAEARHVVYWIIFFAMARSFYAVLGAVTDYLGMTVQRLKGISFGAIAALVGMYIGVTQFGIVGLAIGVGAGYTVLGITLWLYLVEYVRVVVKPI
jgi:O-antigen/teichoic acid export membrane protein